MATHSSVLTWRIPGTGEPGWAAVYGVTQSRTRLKRLSSSSSSKLTIMKWTNDFKRFLQETKLRSEENTPIMPAQVSSKNMAELMIIFLITRGFPQPNYKVKVMI